MLELPVGGQMAELMAEPVGRVDDRCFQLTDRLRAREDGAFASSEQDAQRFAVAASSWLGWVLSGECFAGRAGGVEPVGLGAVATSRPRWPIDLDHPLALLEQEAGQPGAEAARALDRHIRCRAARSRTNRSSRL
jgi:hypothetical protein